jgi:hypothetical protein
MDIPFVLGVALFWGSMVLMVWGFKKLDKSQGDQK